MATTQKRLLVLVLGAMAAVVMAASVAFACAAITTLTLESGTAAAGSTVDGRGDAFRHGDGFENVVLSFESRDGQQLWTGPVAEDRTVQYSFTVPNVAPGHYALIATQLTADGKPVPGSPARTTLQVTAPAAASGAAVAQTEVATMPAPAPVEEVAAPAPAPVPEAVAPAQATATEPAAAAPAAPAAVTPPAAVTAPAPVEAPAPAQATVTEPAAAVVAPAATPRQFLVDAPAVVASAAPSMLPSLREIAGSAPAAGGSGLGLYALAGILGMGMSVLFLARKRRGVGMAVARF